MISNKQIVSSLKNLEQYVKIHNYSGFDPYDSLNSPSFKRINIRLLRLLATQFLVYSPINFRNFLKIQPEKNSKSIGIFLQAYCRLFQQGIVTKKEFENISENLVECLLRSRSMGYSGNCWGFNFDWQDLHRYTQKNIPTIIITTYVAQAFLDLYEVTKSKNYLEIARDCCEFMTKDLHITKTDKGICFSYTPIDRFIIHNANALGAALLARVYAYTKENMLLEYAKKAFNFLISHQKNDGSWAYSFNQNNGKERNQIDFHQGFILDSICSYLAYINSEDESFKESLVNGADFYLYNQFDNSGKSYWRLPLRWPIDIHHQAQGIITFSNLYKTLKEKKYLEFSKKIAQWTLIHMQDSSGYFYYQKWPIITNRIPYMRWGQAWMLLALSKCSGQSSTGDT